MQSTVAVAGADRFPAPSIAITSIVFTTPRSAYSQRLSAQRPKSRLSKIVGTPAYKSMTIGSWATTLALLERMEAPESDG